MKEKKPTSIAEAKALIDRTFRSNKWNEAEQKEYLAGLGIKENVKNLTNRERSPPSFKWGMNRTQQRDCFQNRVTT